MARRFPPWCAAALLAVASSLSPAPLPAPEWATLRQAMVRAIASDVHLTRGDTGRAELLAGVMQAMSAVPRHEFVPIEVRANAYENRPLPIGYGQTISQPYIVALMTDLLEPTPQATMLEVGTGSGYQAAVLSRLVRRVYSIEIIPELAAQAKARLARLQYDNVEVRTGDGYHGWPEAAPFDGIVVTAASDHVPPPLVAQLKPGGRLLVPVGDRFTVQQLVLVHKVADGSLRVKQVLPVRFVPLLGDHAGP